MGGREGRKEGGKEGGREGGKEGEREEEREGGREEEEREGGREEEERKRGREGRREGGRDHLLYETLPSMTSLCQPCGTITNPVAMTPARVTKCDWHRRLLVSSTTDE